MTAGATPADRARAERLAQGLPVLVEDATPYRALAVLLRSHVRPAAEVTVGARRAPSEDAA